MLATQVPEPPGAASGAEVGWFAPVGCADRAALTQAVERRLGRAIAPGELRMDGTVSRHAEAPRYRLRLELTAGGRSQTRTLSAERCASLVDATALLIALTLTRMDLSGPPEPVLEVGEPATVMPESLEPEDAAPEEGMAAPEVATLNAPKRSVTIDEVAPVPAVVVPRGPGGLVRLHGGPEVGAVPGVTGAVGLVTGLLWRRARLEVQGSYVGPRTAVVGASSVRVSLFTGAVLGCGRLGRGALEVPLCGGLELGGARSVAAGPGARSRGDVWLAGVVTAGAMWHVDRRWSLTLALHGLVHLYGPRYELRDPGDPTPLFTPAPVSGRLLVGLELRLGDRW